MSYMVQNQTAVLTGASGGVQCLDPHDCILSEDGWLAPQEPLARQESSNLSIPSLSFRTLLPLRT